MSGPVQRAGLDALLQHPALWRGRGAAGSRGWPTGFAALDAVLPDDGWPRCGLIEVLAGGAGHGELTLWLPLLARLTHHEAARRCVFIAPAFELYAPGWRAAGVRLDRLLVLRANDPLWALEQSLLSGACATGFGWLGAGVSLVALRRLALAAERGAALGVLIRPLGAGRQHTAAVLRLAVARTQTGLSVQLLKGRGLTPRAIAVDLA
jgi:cell division inhibitor SulA